MEVVGPEGIQKIHTGGCPDKGLWKSGRGFPHLFDRVLLHDTQHDCQPVFSVSATKSGQSHLLRYRHKGKGIPASPAKHMRYKMNLGKPCLILTTGGEIGGQGPAIGHGPYACFPVIPTDIEQRCRLSSGNQIKYLHRQSAVGIGLAGVDKSLFFTVSIIEPVQEHMGNTLEGIAVAQLWLAFHPYKIVASLSSTIVFVAR